MVVNAQLTPGVQLGVDPPELSVPPQALPLTHGDQVL